VHNTTTGGDGDKLHPNRLGYIAMGMAIDLNLMRPLAADYNAKHGASASGEPGGRHRGGEHVKRRSLPSSWRPRAHSWRCLRQRFRHREPCGEALGRAPARWRSRSRSPPDALDLSCDAILQTGDGSKPHASEYGLGDRRTKIIKYTYTKAALSREGQRHGRARLRGHARGARPAWRRRDREGGGEDGCQAEVRCSTLVADSLKGERYSLARADPPPRR